MSQRVTQQLVIVDSPSEPKVRDYTIWVHHKEYYGKKRRVAEIYSMGKWEVVFATGMEDYLYDRVVAAVIEYITDDESLKEIIEQIFVSLEADMQVLENNMQNLSLEMYQAKLDIQNQNLKINSLQNSIGDVAYDLSQTNKALKNLSDDTENNFKLVNKSLESIGKTLDETKAMAEQSAKDIEEIQKSQVFLTEDEYDKLVEEGEVDPNVLYFTYEE